jgi:hypothetical protein
VLIELQTGLPVCPSGTEDVCAWTRRWVLPYIYLFSSTNPLASFVSWIFKDRSTRTVTWLTNRNEEFNVSSHQLCGHSLQNFISGVFILQSWLDVNPTQYFCLWIILFVCWLDFSELLGDKLCIVGTQTPIARAPIYAVMNSHKLVASTVFCEDDYAQPYCDSPYL